MLIGADFDYPRSGYIQVVFPPAKKQTVTIPLKTKDDKISEMTETFRLTIVDISLPRGVSVGNMRSAEIEIVDNDRKYYCLIMFNYVYHNFLLSCCKEDKQ